MSRCFYFSTKKEIVIFLVKCSRLRREYYAFSAMWYHLSHASNFILGSIKIWQRINITCSRTHPICCRGNLVLLCVNFLLWFQFWLDLITWLYLIDRETAKRTMHFRVFLHSSFVFLSHNVYQLFIYHTAFSKPFPNLSKEFAQILALYYYTKY